MRIACCPLLQYPLHARIAMSLTNNAPSDEKIAVDEKHATADVEAVPAVHTIRDVYDEGESGVHPIYQAKARVLNEAFMEIGMGKYQWALFVVTGFGTSLYSVLRLLS